MATDGACILYFYILVMVSLMALVRRRGPGRPGARARARLSRRRAPPCGRPRAPARDRASAPRVSSLARTCVCVWARGLFFATHTGCGMHYILIWMFLSASSSSRTWRLSLDFAKAARPVHLHHELLDERLSLRAFVAQLVPLLDERREHLGSRRREPAQHGRQVA